MLSCGVSCDTGFYYVLFENIPHRKMSTFNDAKSPFLPSKRANTMFFQTFMNIFTTIYEKKVAIDICYINYCLTRRKFSTFCGVKTSCILRAQR